MTMRPVDKVEAATADFAVAMRVADLPPISRLRPDVQQVVRETRQRSERLPCGKCGEPILVDVTAVPASVPVICTHCHGRLKAIVARATAAAGRA